MEDKVATLENGNTLVYENPSELIEFDCDEDLYYIKNNQVDLAVTLNHRMYVGNREGKNYKIQLAKDIINKRVKYLKNVEKYDEINENVEILKDQNEIISNNLEYLNKLQISLFHNGSSGNIIKLDNDNFKLVINKKNSPIVNENEKEDYLKHYKGKVYCCTVPSGIVYVRRNGIPIWTGNSSRH